MDKRPFKNQCFECKYYFDDNVPDTCGCGECRFGPPTAIYTSIHQEFPDAKFPLVSEYDWCWRFEKK